MDNIKQWAVTICIICITTGVLNFLIPKGTVKKSAEISISLLLLISLISIFKSDILSEIYIDYSDDIILSYDNDINSYVESMAESEIEKSLKDSLDLICTNDYSIDTVWNISNNTYQLATVVITISSADKENTEKIKSTVGSVTGVIPEVKTSDENQRNTE